MAQKIDFSAELDAELMAAIGAVAEREGKELASLVEEALGDFLKRQQQQVRPHVVARYRESLETFGPLYEQLAR